MEEAYLGVDIGSISTKGVIIDKNYKILASEYIWTEGDPMGAARKLIELLEKQFDKEKYQIDEYVVCSRNRFFPFKPGKASGRGSRRFRQDRSDIQTPYAVGGKMYGFCGIGSGA